MYSGKLTRMYSGELDDGGRGRAARRHLLLSPASAVRGLPGGIFADNQKFFFSAFLPGL